MLHRAHREVSLDTVARPLPILPLQRNTCSHGLGACSSRLRAASRTQAREARSVQTRSSTLCEPRDQTPAVSSPHSRKDS